MECLTLFQIKVYSFSLSLWVSVTIIVVIFSSEEILLGRMRHTNLKVQNFSIRNLKKKWMEQRTKDPSNINIVLNSLT